MTAVGYIPDMEEIVKASWSRSHHAGVASFKMSERSPLPPALSGRDLHGGRTLIFNVCQIERFNHHPVESDQDWAPERISDTEDWVNWNDDFENPNDSEEDCVANDESDPELNTSIEDPECPEQENVNAMRNVRGLVQPTCKSKRPAEMVLVKVNAIETRTNVEVKKI